MLLWMMAADKVHMDECGFMCWPCLWVESKLPHVCSCCCVKVHHQHAALLITYSLLSLGPQCRPPDESMKTCPCPWETEAEDQAGRVQDHTVGCLPGQVKMIKFFTMSMHGKIYIWWEETSEINRTQTCCCNHAKLQELTHAASFVKPRLLSSVLSGPYCHLITYLPHVTL